MKIKMKNKTLLLMKVLLFTTFITNHSLAARNDETIRPKCLTITCCSYSFMGATLSFPVLTGKICFESADRGTGGSNGESQTTLVKIIMDKSEPEAGTLEVKKDNLLTDEETGETYIVIKGMYNVTEDGSCNLNIYKQ